MSVNLLPGHEKRPDNPLPAGAPPGRPYKVKNGDDWASVAKANGVAIDALIANNCGAGATPEVINWYLRERVGCNATRDRRNWIFSDSANPGLLYIPNATIATRASQNPRIKTLYGGPKDLGCGGVQWMVGFELPNPAGNEGWIIQQITRSYDIRNPDGSVRDPAINTPKPTFWEAWPVRKGAVETSNRYHATDEGVTYDDSFDQPRRPNLRGTFKVVGLAKFYEGALPVGFIKNNPHTRSMDLPSSTTRPFFWDDTGTVHNLTVEWDCTRGAGQSEASRIVTQVREKT